MSRTPYPRTDRDLIARIARSPGSKAGYKQLIRELGLGGGRERRLLLEQLTRLVARGDLIRSPDQMWAIPKSGAADSKTSSGLWDGMEAAVRSGRERLISGRLDLHRDGFGFVRPAADAVRPATRSTQGAAIQKTTAPGETREPRPRNHAREPADQQDIFIPPNAINGAMQGDLVLVEESAPGRDGRRSGRIARVLTRRNPSVVGIFHLGGRRHASDWPELRGNYVTPWDDRMGGPIAIAEGDEIVRADAASPHRTIGEEAKAAAQVEDATFTARQMDGLAVDVEITSFPSPGRPARGRIIEVLGPPDAFGVDVEIIIRKHHIPHTFPAAVLAEADVLAVDAASSMESQLAMHREDFRGLDIVTIDGESARDFDDAVLVRCLPNGHTELQVHIADVSWYVRPGSALDTEARVRGTSVYFPDRAVPMLPHALSSGICSLLPNEDRLVLSCIVEIDAEGEIVRYRLAEGILRSVRRMTYTSVQHCIDAARTQPAAADQAAATAEDVAERERVEQENPGLPAEIDRMLDLALRLNAKRVRRGSIDFDLPEPVVEFDPDGNMKTIVRSERGWSHRLIEEFMLSANECVATWLEQQGIPSLYRIHEMPDPKRIVDFEETAAGFGHSLGLGNLPVRKLTMRSERRESRQRSARGRDSRAAQQHEIPESIPVTPQMYQRLVRRISGTPEERILAYLMLRSLKQARYAEQNEGHFALASPSYTHFTSPIRRYPDLIVHRLVRAMLRAGADPRGGPIRSDDPQPWSSAAQGRLRPGVKAISSKPFAPEPMTAEELSDIAAESSQAERRAADAERELIEWKKIKFMADKVGDDFPAVILSCTKYGFFVELDDMFIEGLVPLGSLVGDSYTFRDTDRTIVGARSGHVFALGQKVHVLLDRIDRQQRRLQFALLPGTEPKASSNSGSGSLRTKVSDAKKARSKEKKAAGKAKAHQRKRR